MSNVDKYIAEAERTLDAINDSDVTNSQQVQNLLLGSIACSLLAIAKTLSDIAVVKETE